MNSEQLQLVPLDNDINDIEQEAREILEKLRLTELELKESRIEIQQATMARLEAEQIATKERKLLSELQIKLQLRNNTIDAIQAQKSVPHSSYDNRIKSDYIVVERNMLLDQVKSLQVENMELKQKLRDLEDQVRHQNIFQQTLDAKFSRAVSNNDFVKSQISKLCEEQFILKKTTDEAKILAEKMIVMLIHHHLALNHCNSQIDSLVKQVITKEAEIGKMKDNVKYPEIRYVTLYTPQEKEEQQNLLEQLRKYASRNVEQDEKLRTNLNSILCEIARLEELRNNVDLRMSDLENEVELYKMAKIHRCM